MSKTIEAAARRVVASNLEKQRTYRAYRNAVKDTATTADLEKDPTFQDLRLAMQVAKENHISAQIAYEALTSSPPLN